MSKHKKSAFLILRLPVEVKEEIVERAREAGLTISHFVRDQLNKILHG